MNDNAFELTTDALYAEDLLALERRRELTEHEQRRLSMCLTGSDALRILRQLHNDFESFDSDNADDARITELCVSEVTQHFATRKVRTSGRRTRLRMSLIGASALLLTLAAAAASHRVGFWGHEVRRGLLPPLSTPKPLAVNAGSVHASNAPDPQASTTGHDDDVKPPIASCSSEPTGDSEVLPRSASSPNIRSIRGSNAEPTTLATNTVKSAVELFSVANAARRAGKTQEAVALYQRLQAQYPSSDEALVSHVLLARLELGRGASPKALREFDAYLERAPSGALTQEALQGRAQALSRLGRKQEETATWQKLLQEFPNSVYARSAREHLGESKDAR